MNSTPFTEQSGESPEASSLDFDSFASAYDYFSRNNAYNALYERPAMRALLPVDLSGLRVLDAGCASGLHAAWMAERGAAVLAIDNDPAMVSIAKRRLGNLANVIHADLTQPLHFIEAASVDWVFCSLTLHYIADWGPTLAEFRRVLVGGGRLLISTHHPCADRALGGTDYFSLERLTQVWSEFGRIPYEVVFYRRPLSATVKSLTEAGFSIEKLIEPQPQPEMMRIAPKIHAKLLREPGFVILQMLAS